MKRMDGYDDCIAGLGTRYGQPSILIYDMARVLKKLESDGMTREEAVEYFHYNMIGAWVGDDTPAFLEPFDPFTEL